MRVDLNADVGEWASLDEVQSAVGLIAVISSANVAAGVHAGSPPVIRRTIRLAREHGVAVGAHPGLADTEGFGRREQLLSPSSAEDLVLYQVAAVAGIAAAEGVRLRHVKLHGALYHMAARDADLAAAIVRAIAASDRLLTVFGPPGSELLHAARKAGLGTATEGFADRAYQPDGRLVGRDQPGALILDAQQVLARALQIVREGRVMCTDGSTIPLRVDTLCIHGDTPGAAAIARALRAGLDAAGVIVAPRP